MTKKHFEAMAAYVRNEVENKRDRAAQILCNGFIDLAEQFNPRFDRNRFMVACGLSDGISSDSRARRELFESSKATER
jgi:hypothetical protein